MNTPKIVKTTPVGQGIAFRSPIDAIDMYNRVMFRREAQYRYRVLSMLIDCYTLSNDETARIMVTFQDAMINFCGSNRRAGARALFFYRIHPLGREVFQAAVDLFQMFVKEVHQCQIG